MEQLLIRVLGEDIRIETVFEPGLAPVRVDPAQLVMALAYGDQWSNMLQPFWALPLLAVTQIRARDIVGYTVLIMMMGQVFFLAGLYLGWG